MVVAPRAGDRRGLGDGAPVRRGELIGWVGASGRATGPHLHFALSRDGRYFDPLGRTAVTARDDGDRVAQAQTCGASRSDVPGLVSPRLAPLADACPP